jgi:hypothetical protein
MLLAVGPGLGLPVMHRPDDLLATDCASGADPVFHHEGLAQNALEMSVYDAANGLGCAPAANGLTTVTVWAG